MEAEFRVIILNRNYIINGFKKKRPFLFNYENLFCQVSHLTYCFVGPCE